MNDNKDTQARIYLKADDGKLSKVIRFNSESKVEIPINRDGSVRWYDDSKLIKKATN